MGEKRQEPVTDRQNYDTPKTLPETPFFFESGQFRSPSFGYEYIFLNTPSKEVSLKKFRGLPNSGSSFNPMNGRYRKDSLLAGAKYCPGEHVFLLRHS
jgi:hypothetical protein